MSREVPFNRPRLRVDGWQLRAYNAIRELKVKNGATWYFAWRMRTFGEENNQVRWEELALAAEHELEHPSECGCVLPEQSCEVCRSMSHVIFVTQELD